MWNWIGTGAWDSAAGAATGGGVEVGALTGALAGAVTGAVAGTGAVVATGATPGNEAGNGNNAGALAAEVTWAAVHGRSWVTVVGSGTSGSLSAVLSAGVAALGDSCACNVARREVVIALLRSLALLTRTRLCCSGGRVVIRDAVVPAVGIGEPSAGSSFAASAVIRLPPARASMASVGRRLSKGAHSEAGRAVFFGSSADVDSLGQRDFSAVRAVAPKTPAGAIVFSDADVDADVGVRRRCR